MAILGVVKPDKYTFELCKLVLNPLTAGAA